MTKLKGDLSRDQAIARVGEDNVVGVERENCDFTNRLMPPGYEDQVEFSASIRCQDINDDEVTLLVYYYQDAEQVKETDDLSSLNWDIEGYEII